jgi:hypothetical protein
MGLSFQSTRRWRLATGAFSVRLAGSASLLACVSGCSNSAGAEPPPAVSSEPSQRTLVEPLLGGDKADDKAAEDAALRRGYGVVDMRANPCVKRDGDKAFLGERCPDLFLIYGPYVKVPANSDIEVSFDVTVSQRMEVYADIVSQMGGQTLAGLSRQVVEPGSARRLGYRVHVFSESADVESRIGFGGMADAGFTIANLTMTVR